MGAEVPAVAELVAFVVSMDWDSLLETVPLAGVEGTLLLPMALVSPREDVLLIEVALASLLLEVVGIAEELAAVPELGPVAAVSPEPELVIAELISELPPGDGDVLAAVANVELVAVQGMVTGTLIIWEFSETTTVEI